MRRGHEDAGPAAILAFALNGVLSLLTAFSFAELASSFPESGGGYVFAKKVFPIGGAFAAGWVLWFAYVVAGALYALGFASILAYALHVLLGLETPGWFDAVFACAVALAATFMLARRGAGGGSWISFAKIVAFLVLIAGGAVAFGRRPAGALDTSFMPFMPFGAAGILVAMGYTFSALEGFEVIASIAEEVKSPGRTIPRAMFLSIAVGLAVYMGLFFVVLAAGGPPDGTPAWKELGGHGDSAMAVAAARFMGGPGATVVVVAGLLSTFSALAATLLAASRVSFSMARDRALPSRLSALGGKANTPVKALFVSVGLVLTVIAVTADVEIAGAAASLIFLLSFALTNAAGLLVRFRGGAASSYRAPFYPGIPILGMTACLGLAIFQATVVPKACLVVLVWLVLGGGLYRSIFGARARTVSARTEAWDDQLVRLRGRNPLVLVPIANPDRAEALLHFAYALATPGVGRVLVLTVVPLDPAKGAEAGRAAFARVEASLPRCVEEACRMGRTFEGTVLVVEDVLQAIAQSAAVRGPETVLLGMSNMAQAGGLALLEGIIGSTVADVAVLNAPPGWSLDGAKRLLVPVAGGAPNDPLRARVLGTLLREAPREATILRVLLPGEDRPEAERDLYRQADDLGVGPERCAIEESADAVDAIVRRSADADLLILGFGAHGGRRRIMGDFALRIVGGAKCAVVAIAQARARRL
ncbi:MAG TPA: amino acid permease [Planctomycetota bacterium]|nr:amino acid permease [Planctomycetota bacterium]